MTRVDFDRPHFEDGTIFCGPYDDGQGDAKWRLFTGGRLASGLIVGGIGSGVSNVLKVIALTAQSAGVALVYLDGQNGASSPTLWKRAMCQGDVDKASSLVLPSLLRLKEARQMQYVAESRCGFTPNGDTTGILVIADQCQGIFSKNTDGWATLAREGAKVGIGLVGASQYADLGIFGGSLPLRETLTAHNMMALRTLSRSTQPLLSVDTTRIPNEPGAACMVTDRGGALFHNRFASDEVINNWFDMIPQPRLDELSATVLNGVLAS